ncbi:MAG: CGNR zinc finger domain-containing protein [Bacteroidetes bacterium]|nr:CGNR zinc finger domain-containing protein [Bacteroidota bacterium]
MTRERYTTWATNERDEKILIALQLDTANFKIILYTFEESAITKDFANKMLNEWTKGEAVEFPEGTVGKDLELSDDALLPENIKVEERQEQYDNSKMNGAMFCSPRNCGNRSI